GFISTYNGRIYRTTNGGLNWADESYISSGLNFGAYTFIDAETVYMLGSNRLFKTTNGGILTDQPEKSITFPVSVNLLQNFPNPFNPSTTISFSIAKSSFVRLNIYNISGKKIEELVNEFRLSGDYNIVFNAANLPSGVYFCKLEVIPSNTLYDDSKNEANDFTATKRMILFK
ncbi:MAG: T9SS type A sorting domain-containing protein, partial [Ignavibacteria bacterium]|nr:T9SS type A sorting domain-containing protein [Ignavibacteria bacterium]